MTLICRGVGEDFLTPTVQYYCAALLRKVKVAVTVLSRAKFGWSSQNKRRRIKRRDEQRLNKISA